MSSKLRARIKRTIIAANGVDGRGNIIKIVWHPTTGKSGIAVRHDSMGLLDAIQFTVLSRGVHVLGKARVLVP